MTTPVARSEVPQQEETLPTAAYRHRWEMRMVAVGVTAAIVLVIAFIVTAANHSSLPGWLQSALFVTFASPVILFFAIRYQYWKAVVDAVEVTDTQYPELYAIFKGQVAKAGLDYMPRLYVTNGNGLINAFASKGRLDITKGAFVVCYSDVVDTLYDLGNVETIRFVLSHELGHLKLGHVHVRRALLNNVLKPFFLGNSLTRAQEYSADRFAASITQGTALSSLALLAAGKRNYERMDLDAYIDNDAAHISRLWVALINFQANHAVGRRRLAAARQMDEQGWQGVHGRML